MLTQWQRLIADTYGDGDYQHVQTLEECRDVRDTLFTFLMIETDPKEDCGDWLEALRRVRTSMSQLEELYEKLRNEAPYLTERAKHEQEARA